MKYTCPICYYPDLEEEPYGSFEICPRCGVEFGYEDHCTAGKDSEERKKILQKLRERFLKDGPIN